MKKIMLVCAAGMSTSLLVTKMIAAAKELGDEIEIFALPISEGEKKLAEVDCVLLGPQVRFQKAQIEKAIAQQKLDLAVAVIDMKDYGMMNGKAVYQTALSLMKK